MGLATIKDVKTEEVSQPALKTTFQETVFIGCKWGDVKHIRLTKCYFIFFISIYPTMCYN